MKVAKKLKQVKYAKVLIFSVIFLIFVVSIANVGYCAATITPDSGQVWAGIPTSFSVEGATADTYYDIEVDDVVKIDDLKASSDGDLSFTLTFTKEGYVTVEVVENGTTTVIATAQLEVVDLIDFIMPYIVFAMYIMLLGGVVGAVMILVKGKW